MTLKANALIISIGLLFNSNCLAEIVRIPEDSKSGFEYPYYLYIPDGLNHSKITLLVVPNNTGVVNDTLQVHENVAKKQLLIWAKISDKLNTAILMPVFPRTKSASNIYTHALDRDALTIKEGKFKRFDHQLIRMISNATYYFKVKNIILESKVWMTGFSASGMFVNRFAIIHPELVKAAAIGSPGGWPIAPMSAYKGKALRYPVGIADLESISGVAVDKAGIRKVPLLFYMGDMDVNDSVVYPDGYDPEDKELVFELFGKTPIERWKISEEIYFEEKLNATFKLYPGANHSINNRMIEDIVVFFKSSN